MKTHAQIIVIFLLAVCFVNCRSSRQLDKSVQEKSQTETDYSRTAENNSRLDQQTDVATIAIKNEIESIRIIKLDTLGRVREIQEIGRNTRQTQLGTSTNRSSDVSVTTEKADSTIRSSNENKTVIQENTKTDSRPVQGSEWFWVILAAALLAAAIIYGLYRYFKK